MLLLAYPADKRPRTPEQVPGCDVRQGHRLAAVSYTCETEPAPGAVRDAIAGRATQVGAVGVLLLPHQVGGSPKTAGRVGAVPWCVSMRCGCHERAATQAHGQRASHDRCAGGCPAVGAAHHSFFSNTQGMNTQGMLALAPGVMADTMLSLEHPGACVGADVSRCRSAACWAGGGGRRGRAQRLPRAGGPVQALPGRGRGHLRDALRARCAHAPGAHA